MQITASKINLMLFGPCPFSPMKLGVERFLLFTKASTNEGELLLRDEDTIIKLRRPLDFAKYST